MSKKIADFKVVKTAPIKLTEKIPQARAVWLVNRISENPEILCGKGADQNKPGGMNIDSETFVAWTKSMVAKAAFGDDLKGDAVNELKDVDYKPSSHGYGRLWSTRNTYVTLQGACKYVRHTLVSEIYDDVDIVNCFPELLRQYNEMNFPEVKTPTLNKYCRNRDTIIGACVEESKDATVDREFVKKAILVVMFGGNVIPHPKLNVNAGIHCTNYYATLNSLKLEIKKMSHAFLNSNSSSSKIIKSVVATKKSKSSSKKDNEEGAAMSLLAQCIETVIIKIAMRVYEKKMTETGDPSLLVATNCFDGFMVPKNTMTDDILASMSSEILEETGFDVKFVVKPMTEGDKTISDQEIAEIQKLIETKSLNTRYRSLMEKLSEEEESLNNPVVKVRGYDDDEETPLRLKELYIVSEETPLDFRVEKLVKHLYSANLLMYSKKTETVYVRSKNSNLWESGITSCMNTLHKDRWLHRIVNEVYDKKDGKVLCYSSNTSTIQKFHIKSSIETILPKVDTSEEEPYDRITDETRNKIFYKDGYYDLSKKTFVTIEQDPKASTFVRVGRNFLDDAKLRNEMMEQGDEHEIVKEVRDKYLSVFGFKKELQDYALKTFARAMGGDFDKQWSICLGDRNSGKGCWTHCMVTTFIGGYVTTFNTPIVKASISDPSVANREIISSHLYRARVAFSDEIAKDAVTQNSVLDGNFIKNVASGGDRVVARTMHKDEQHCRVTAMMFMNMNEVPKVRPTDALETMRQIFFPNKYEVSGKYASGLKTLIEADSNIKINFTQNTKFHIAIETLIFRNWIPRPICDKDVPEEVREQDHINFSDERKETSSLNVLFGRLFEVGDKNTDKIKSSDIYDAFKKEESKGFDIKPTKSDEMRYAAFLKNQGDVFVSKRVESNKQRFTAWFGIKYKQIQKEEEEDN